MMVNVGELTPEPNPARELIVAFEKSDGWQMEGWTIPALVMTRAALRDMLRRIETEMGRRKMMGPTR